MGVFSWEPVALSLPGIQWRGYGAGQRFRCVGCGREALSAWGLVHLPACKHARNAAQPPALSL